jgi:hypothetical protein
MGHEWVAAHQGHEIAVGWKTDEMRKRVVSCGACGGGERGEGRMPQLKELRRKGE